MRNPALFLLTCFLFVSLFNLPLLVSSQSNPQVRHVFQVTEGSKLYSQASDIIHFKPSAYTGSPWNFVMNDLYDSNLYFRKSAYFWVRHNFTSAPASEVRLVRAASTIAKAPVISTDAHFMVTLTWSSGNVQINLVYPVTGTTPVTQTLTSSINLKAYTWYGVFISRNVLAGSDQGALFVYDPSTVSGSAYNYDLQAPATVAPSGYSSTSATSNFYIDIGGDTQISSPSNCEIANFNFLYKIDFYNTATAILELIKQPPRLVLWLEYKEMDSDVQLVMDSSNSNNVVFRGDSQFDTNSDSALNSDATTNADVGHIYSQNGFDTIYPAFDLGKEYAISFWTKFNTRPSTVTTDTNQIVFFKQNSQYSKMQIRLGFQGTSTTITNFVLQSGNTVATPSLAASITRGDGNWYYFYIYMASYYKNETTTGPTTFHPTTLYTVRYTTAAGAVATTLSGIINDYFIHGGTTDAMRIGMGVDGQNEYFYGIIKQFQVFTGGWNFDVSSDPSLMVVGGANTIHITDGVLSTRVFSQKCATSYQLSENDCVATCPSESYQVTADTNFPHCEACYENCLTCTGRKDQMCQSCVYGNWLPFGYVNCPGKNACNIHQYDTGTYCQECNNECASCKDSDSCTACSDGYAYNLATEQCEIATCGDGVVHTGEQCDDGNQFDGDGCSTSCTIEQGFYCPQFGGTCYSVCGDNVPASNEACDDGNNINGDGCNYACQVEDNYFCTPLAVTANIGPFYGATYKEGCTTCGSNCKTCATASTCAVCATSYFLYGTSCVSSCPTTGYYPNTTSQTCIACPSLCSQCTSNTVCTLCSGTNALLNSQCYDTCPDGTYSGLSGGIQSCLTCPSHCTTCSSSSSCYSCDDGWYLQNPGASSGTCAQCDGTCKTCRGGATTDCILCPTGRTLKTATSECVILSCLANEYANTSIGVCQPCDATCATCLNTLATGCKTCPSLNALTVNNMCLSCNVANNANGLYLIGTTCNDICGDGKRVMKTTGCDDGNTVDGDGCSSKCVVESGWSCSGGSETTADTCVSLVGPQPIITVSDRDPTSFLISFDRQVINTLQPSEYVTQIVVALEGLDPDLSLYSISWDSVNQIFTVSFDLKESAVDSLLSVQFTDPSRITDTFSNQLSPALTELTYPAYYYVDPDTKKLADNLQTFSVVIQSINTASIIPLALTGYLNHYWLFLESFQVVHDLMLINVRTPYIAEKFFESFHYMRMNWLPNALKAANLDYNQTQQLGTDRYYDLEINSFYLENNGYQLTAWVFLLVVWLSLKIVILIGLKNTYLKQLIYSIVINLEWSIIIRAVVILYFDFCIYSFLQLTNMTRDTPAMTASSVMAIVSTVFIGVFPIFCLYQTLKVKNQYLLTTDTRFDTLYREYKKRFKSTITFLTITLYQKALIAAFLVGLQSQPQTQIGLLAGQEILMLMLLLVIRPYVDGSMNFRAIIQELVMFAAFAMFYGLTKENTDENVRDNVGRVIVGLIIVALLMHLIFLIKDSYLTIKNHYKRAGVDKQIFGKVRITPLGGQEEFQLNNIIGENPDVSASDRNIIPKSQDRFSMEDGSHQHIGDQENTNFMADHENTNFRDTMSPATPVKESVFAYED